jgi:hypothetical protein
MPNAAATDDADTELLVKTRNRRPVCWCASASVSLSPEASTERVGIGMCRSRRPAGDTGRLTSHQNAQARTGGWVTHPGMRSRAGRLTPAVRGLHRRDRWRHPVRLSQPAGLLGRVDPAGLLRDQDPSRAHLQTGLETAAMGRDRGLPTVLRTVGGQPPAADPGPARKNGHPDLEGRRGPQAGPRRLLGAARRARPLPTERAGRMNPGRRTRCVRTANRMTRQQNRPWPSA